MSGAGCGAELCDQLCFPAVFERRRRERLLQQAAKAPLLEDVDVDSWEYRNINERPDLLPTWCKCTSNPAVACDFEPFTGCLWCQT